MTHTQPVLTQVATVSCSRAKSARLGRQRLSQSSRIPRASSLYAALDVRIYISLLTISAGLSTLNIGMFSLLLRQLSQVAAGLSGNALVLSNVVALRWARLVVGWMTVCGYTILVFNQNHPGLFILAIPPWVGTMSTGGGLGHR